jgi:3-oxoacyl-[acyl-carrier protein] reductase
VTGFAPKMLILITGTSKGIGRALGEQLAQAGHTILGCSRRPVSTQSEGYRHFQIDLTAPDQVKQMFHSIKEEYGFLDALINNAGTAIMNPFLLTPDSEIERIFRINVFAVFSCSREAVKLMRHSQHEAPSIINLSTVAVSWSIPGQSIDASSKSAIEQATRTLSHELADMNIRVNTISLPPMRTALTRSIEPAKIAALIERQAIKRMCNITDVLGPIEFLLSPAAKFVTGSTLFLGGVL